jgi:hypothetical protein
MLVIDTGLETAERIVKAWAQLKSELPLDAESKERIDQQFKCVPITRRFLPGSLATTPPDRTIRKKAVRRHHLSR